MQPLPSSLLLFLSVSVTPARCLLLYAAALLAATVAKCLKRVYGYRWWHPILYSPSGSLSCCSTTGNSGFHTRHSCVPFHTQYVGLEFERRLHIAYSVSSRACVLLVFPRHPDYINLQHEASVAIKQAQANPNWQFQSKRSTCAVLSNFAGVAHSFYMYPAAVNAYHAAALGQSCRNCVYMDAQPPPGIYIAK